MIWKHIPKHGKDRLIPEDDLPEWLKRFHRGKVFSQYGIALNLSGNPLLGIAIDDARCLPKPKFPTGFALSSSLWAVLQCQG